MPEKPAVGSIAWTDLTVPDATLVRDFYQRVVGWTHEPVDMGGYVDFNMREPAGGRTVAGICYARGGNADLPRVWLVYICVADLDTALDGCRGHGGVVLAGPKGAGPGRRYAVIQDPAGAIAGLYEDRRPMEAG